MKLLSNKASVLLGVSTAIGLLALGSQAHAAGTDAGTPIDNTATISYSVNAEPQADITADAPQFLVDRVVTFELQPVDDANLTDVELAQTGITVYTLTNTGNSPMDFDLAALDLAGGATFGSTGQFTDDADMALFEIFVANGNNDGTVDPDPTSDSAFVDGIPEDATRRIWVRATAPTTGLNDQVAGVELTATAADPGDGTLNGLGAILSESGSDTAGAVDTVFDEDGGGAGGDGIQIAQDGYRLVSAVLDIAKNVTVISDPVNGTGTPFAIPGAIVEYAVTITNNGTITATSLAISDSIQADLVFQENIADASPADPTSALYLGEDVVIDLNNGATVETCSVDTGPDCGLTGSDLSVDVPDLAAGDTVTVLFRAQIATTP